MSRVEAASGAKYSAQKEAPRKFEPIAPVGTNYTPVGKIDMNELRKGQNPSTPKAVVPPASSRPAFSSLTKPSVATAASLYGNLAMPKTTSSGPTGADALPTVRIQPALADRPPPIPPASSRPSRLPNSARPAFSASVSFWNISWAVWLILCL